VMRHQIEIALRLRPCRSSRLQAKTTQARSKLEAHHDEI
jgi:hypothetical protein